MNRKGFRQSAWIKATQIGGIIMIVFMQLPIATVQAAETQESVDEIISMLDWWDSYGRYWDEIGADTSVDETINFAKLDEEKLLPAAKERGGQE